AFKAVRAAETAALVAWSAVANGDRVGGLVFSEQAHHELRPRLGRGTALRLFQLMSMPSLWTFSPSIPEDRPEDPADHALQRLIRVTRPGSLVFLLSDFRDLGESFETRVRQLAGRGDVF